MLEPSEVPCVERIGGPQRQSDAMQRNRVIGTDGFQGGDRRSPIDKIVFAVDLEPTDERPLGPDVANMRGAHTDARGDGECGRGRHWFGSSRKMRRRDSSRLRAPAQVSKTRRQDFGAAGLPPTFSQVPLATYFHDTGSLSTVLC